MTTRHLLAAALLAASAAPAAAAFNLLKTESVGDWVIETYEDSDGGKPQWCLLTGFGQGGNKVTAKFRQKMPPDPKVSFVYVSLANPAWTIGQDSAGSATVEIQGVTRTLQFKRHSEHEVESALETDEASNKWLGGVLAGRPISVKLPTSAAYTIPAMSRQAAASAAPCMLAAKVGNVGALSGPAPVSGPTPAPVRSGPSKDPFVTR